MTNTFNGFRNYETWNVALWINNDPGFYAIAQQVREIGDFIDCIFAQGWTHTPDGVEFDGPALDYARLDDLIQEIN